MPSTYNKLLFRIEAGELADYSAPDRIFEEGKEHIVVLNRREYDSIVVPAAGVVTIAIGTEVVLGMYIRCTDLVTGVLVKWTQSANVNHQKLGESSPVADNGEWMFVPKVDSSTNVTLETADAVASTARVVIIHT